MQQSDRVRMCWIVGAISGLVVLLFVSGLGDTHWLGGAFLGLITFFLLGATLIWLSDAPDLGGLDLETDLIEAAAARAATSSPVNAVITTQAASLQEAPMAQTAVAKSGAADDLKVINGIGIKIEEALHQLGVTQFAQIAAWDAGERQDFATKLGRLGRRIEADDWVGQAQALMNSGAVNHG